VIFSVQGIMPGLERGICLPYYTMYRILARCRMVSEAFGDNASSEFSYLSLAEKSSD